MSVPISAINDVAARSFMPGMVCNRFNSSGKNSLYHTSSVSVAFEGTFGKQFIQNDGNIRFKQRIIL
jgi:hypothetical protein